MAVLRLTIDKVLQAQNITRYELSKRTGIGYPIIDKYYKNNVVRYDSYVLAQICSALDCGISDIVELIDE